MPRNKAALQLRDHALAILRRKGSCQSAGEAGCLTWKNDAFGMALRTPFREDDTGHDAGSLAATHDLPPGHAAYLATLHLLKLPEVLPYGLDIWRGGKVLSLEWSDDGRTKVIDFKRGDWEAELLALTA